MKHILITLCVMIGFVAPASAEIKIQEFSTQSGQPVWLVEEHAIPFVALEIEIRGGTSLDRAGKRGSIHLMTGLLEEGAGDLDAQSFAAARDGMAASYSFNVGRDSLTISARFLSENRDEAVALLKTALTDPRFDEEAVERVHRQVSSGIKSDDKDPQNIAKFTLDQQAFGEHPYATRGKGTVDSIAELTIADIRTAFADAVVKDRALIGIAGDLTKEQAIAMLDDLLGDLPVSSRPIPEAAPFDLSGGTTVVEFPSPQSVALFGHSGIKREDPDFFAAFVMNQVLGGGGFNSRLTEEVREKRGLTYGISSFLVQYELADYYLGIVRSANDTVGQAIDVVRAEWERMASAGVTEAELVAAKQYMTGAYPLRFDGNAQIAGILVGMQSMGLPVEYINSRNDRINAVTQQQISDVAKRLLREGDLRVVIVGQPEGVISSN
jgi:zinc protease